MDAIKSLLISMQKCAQLCGELQIGHGPVENKGIEGEDTSEQDEENLAHGAVMSDTAFFFVVVSADTGSVHVVVIVTAGAVLIVLMIVTAGTVVIVLMIVTAGAAVIVFFVNIAHYFFSSACGAFTLFSRFSWNQTLRVPLPSVPRMNLSSTGDWNASVSVEV